MKTKNVKDNDLKPRRKTFVGKVISTKMQKTVVVEVEQLLSHPLYKKFLRRRKKYKAHTEENLSVGDKVKIMQCRPISKEKKWKVVEVL